MATNFLELATTLKYLGAKWLPEKKVNFKPCFLNLWVKSQIVTIQMKATEQYFPVVLFIMLHKVVLTFESAGEILNYYEHLNESY